MNSYITIIFKKSEVMQLIEVAQQIRFTSNGNMSVNKEKLKNLPLEMYKYLQKFVQLGKKEGKLKAHIPDGLILGFIFQSLAIP